jgi:hypothetical protein
MSWRAIAEELKTEPYKIDLTLQAVRAFFKSANKRKTLPLGFEPEPSEKAVTAEPATKQQDKPAQSIKKSPQEMEEDFLRESAKRQNKSTAFPIADLDE